MAKKKKSKLKKIAGALAAGLGAAALMRGRDKGAVTADMPRSMVPMKKRMVQGLNFPGDTDLSGIDDWASRGSIDDKKDYYKKGGLVKKGKPKLAKKGWK